MQVSIPQTGLVLKNILYLTDFSDAAQKAFGHALALAESYKAKLSILHVVEPPPRLAVPLDPLPRSMNSGLAEAEKQMDYFLRQAPMRGGRREVIVSEGEMESVVADAVERGAIDLIVLGTHGRTGLEKVLLGSTAELVLRVAAVPVLTIGPKAARREARAGRSKTILFATDFSANSLAALPHACSVVREDRARLVIVHVLPDDLPRDGQIEAELKTRLMELLPVGVLSSCESEFVVEFGGAAEKIVDVARNCAADLLVLGVRSVAHPSLASHLPWPHLSAVLAEAPCPVLTVRRAHDLAPA